MANTGVLWRYVLQRGGLLLGLGLLISLATYLLLGAEYVRFGILHLLGSGLVLAVPFTQARLSVTLTVGLLLLGVGTWLNMQAVTFPWLIWLGLPQAGVGMVDYYPLLPWFGVVLLGVALGRVGYPNGRRLLMVPELAHWSIVRSLCWLGRHALLIYLLHQPVLLGLLIALQQLRA
jgi:uncharacterized membrane protein